MTTKKPTKGLVFLDWKDPSGNLWKDVILEEQLEVMKKDSRITIVKEVHSGF